MSVADFLKDLPSRNKDNFTKINAEAHHRAASSGKKNTYLPTKDIPVEHVIVTEKTNILLRYLHDQWDKKNNSTKKRLGDDAQDEVAAKKCKLETIPDTSNTGGGSGGAAGPGPSRREDGGATAHFRGPTAASHTGPPPPYEYTPPNRFRNQQ